MSLPDRPRLGRFVDETREEVKASGECFQHRAFVAEDLDIETLGDGNELSSWFSASSASTASCLGSPAAFLATTSTLG